MPMTLLLAPRRQILSTGPAPLYAGVMLKEQPPQGLEDLLGRLRLFHAAHSEESRQNQRN